MKLRTFLTSAVAAAAALAFTAPAALAQRRKFTRLVALDQRDAGVQLDVDAAIGALADLVGPQLAALAPGEGRAQHQRHAVFALVRGLRQGGGCGESQGGCSGHGRGEERTQFHYFSLLQFSIDNGCTAKSVAQAGGKPQRQWRECNHQHHHEEHGQQHPADPAHGGFHAHAGDAARHHQVHGQRWRELA